MTNHVAALRSELNMTMKEFGKELGVVHTTVMRWESGDATPRPYIDAALRELAARYGVKWPLTKKRKLQVAA